MHVVCSQKYKFCLKGLGIATDEDFNKTPVAISNFIESRRLNEECKLILLSTHYALENAMIDIKKIDPKRIGIAISTIFGGFVSYERFYENFKNGNPQPHEFKLSLANAATSAVSIFYNIKGPTVTLVGIENYNLMETVEMFLVYNMCEIVFAGFCVFPSQTLLSYTNQNAFSIMGIFSSVTTSGR